MKQPDFEKILLHLSQQHENKYSSFPSLIENEMSLEVYEVVTQVMKEAWNAAVDACAESAEVFCNSEAIQDEGYFEVDKNSILKNKIQ